MMIPERRSSLLLYDLLYASDVGQEQVRVRMRYYHPVCFLCLWHICVRTRSHIDACVVRDGSS